MIRIGLIGCGKWGQNHARILKTLPCEFVGIADSDPAKEQFAEELGVPYFQKYQAFFDIADAVVIASPTLYHYAIAHDVLTHDIHAFVEKPLTLSLQTTQTLVAHAQKKNLVLSVGYLYRFHPIVLELKKRLVKAGPIHYVSVCFVGGQNRLWMDSGAIRNFGIHMIDTLNFLFPEKPLSVFATKKNLFDDNREDSAIILLQYHEFYAQIEVSCIHPKKARELWVHTEKEKFFADFQKNTLTTYDLPFDAKGVALKTAEESILHPPLNNPLQSELLFFIQRVEDAQKLDGKSTGNNSEENLDTVAICDLAEESARRRKIIACKR